MFLLLILMLTTSFSPISYCATTGVKSGIDKNDLTKIINGDYAYIDDFPYLVSINVNGRHYCGGVLVRYNWVLTAAHCMNDYNSATPQFMDLRRISVQAGMTQTENFYQYYPGTYLPPYPTIDPVKGDATHDPEPSYSDLHSPNRKAVFAKFYHMNPRDFSINEDVVLLKIFDKFEHSKKMHPPEKWPDKAFTASLTPGTMCTVAGWGWKLNPGASMYSQGFRRSANGVTRPRVRQSAAVAGHASFRSAQEGNVLEEHVAPKTHKNSRMPGALDSVRVYLNSALVQFQDMSHCNARIPAGSYRSKNSSLQVCANETVKASCRGDSGGPLICHGIIVGILSFGLTECGNQNGYAVYSRLDSYMDWINRTIDAHGGDVYSSRDLSAATTERASFLPFVVFCVSGFVSLSRMFS